MTSSSSPRHILIFGSGAVGLFYGSRLHQPDATPPVLVSLVCRSNYHVVSTSGVALKTRDFGDYHFSPHAVYKSVSDARDAAVEGGYEWDTVFVATKALPDPGAPALLRPLYDGVEGQGPAIVLVQNGVEIERPWREEYGRAAIVSAVTVVSAEQTGDGEVRQYKWTRISMGPYVRGRRDDERDAREEWEEECERRAENKAKELKEWFTRGGIKDAETYDEVGLQLVRWHKLALNGAMNPSAVLSGGSTNSSMTLDPELRLHLRGVMQEVFDSAPKIVGRPWTPNLLKASPDVILTSMERNTDGRSSMLVDWEKGRPTEIEAILGNAVRAARERGVELRRLQTLYALMKMQERKRKESRL